MGKALHIGLVCTANLAFTRGVMRGVKGYALAQNHWTLVPCEPEALTVRMLRASHCDGLIAHVFTPALAETLAATRRPVVNVAAVLPDLPFPRVGVELETCGKQAAEHFLERGLRHFAFMGHRGFLFSDAREAGFRQALLAAGEPREFDYKVAAQPFRRAGLLLALDGRLQRWLRARPKPLGVFAASDLLAFQVAEACRLSDLHVPDDVAIVGVDNDDLLCEMARPSLSSIALPAEAIGYQAASLLDNLLKGASPPTQPLLLPPLGVVKRQSSDLLLVPDSEVAAATRFIRNHAHLPLQVKDVLREVPASRRSLELRFRRLLGRGIGEEIRQVHLERAKELLARTRLSIAEVADASGFAYVQHLSRIFHEETGFTPTAYRRKFRGQSHT